jgi:molecular chaperone GrpE
LPEPIKKIRPEQTAGPELQDAPSEIQNLEQKIIQLEAEKNDLSDKYIYLYAEFDNFKKRALNERLQTLKFAPEPLVRDLLEVIDNLERSLNHLPPEEAHSGLSQGLKMTLNQFLAVLENHGVKRIQTAGAGFDPNFHEAVGEIPSDQPRGTILVEQRPGYLFQDRLLRPSQVILSKHRD